MKEKYIDFKCSCGDTRCGKVRVCRMDTKIETIVDIGFIPHRCKNPKSGIVIREKEIKKLLELIK